MFNSNNSRNDIIEYPPLPCLKPSDTELRALVRNQIDELNSNEATALGDPYIYSIRSSVPVKLPDTEASYRLYQCDDTYINAEVLKAAPEHQQRMIKFADKQISKNEKFHYNINEVVTDGYFFSKFFICEKNKKMVVDLHKKNIIVDKKDMKFFNIESNNNVVGIKNQKGVSNNIVIDWVTEEGNKVTATIHFFKNPHMENGISLSVSNLPSKALGLCVSNYRPKLMKLPNLTTEKYEKIKKRVKNSKNPFQQIKIKKNTESWIQYNEKTKHLVDK